MRLRLKLFAAPKSLSTSKILARKSLVWIKPQPSHTLTFPSSDFFIVSHNQPPTLPTQQPRTMGTGKKEANRKIRQGKVGDGMANVKTKGENFYRFAFPSSFLRNGG